MAQSRAVQAFLGLHAPKPKTMLHDTPAHEFAAWVPHRMAHAGICLKGDTQWGSSLRVGGSDQRDNILQSLQARTELGISHHKATVRPSKPVCCCTNR